MPDLQTPTPRYFLCKLIPHVQYWTARMVEGIALVFGPVLDPAGPWGLGSVRVQDEAALQRL